MYNSFTLGSTKEADTVKILQSCNGLLLCSGSASPAFYYVYNPCTNLFKRLPQPKNSHDDSHFHVTVVLRMAFDPRKSFDYKVVQVAARPNSDLEIQVYSSETDIPGMLHLEGRLFESRGCLLLVCRDDIGSREFTIYEIMKGCSMWTVQYLVNTDEFMTLLPKRWSIRSTVWSIGLGEREENSFLVINLPGKVLTDSRLDSRKSTMDNSFGSVEEVDHVRILQCCNGLLLCVGKFFESCGCLFLVCRDDIGYREFTIYEMTKGCSLWSVRYLVNTEELMNPLPEGWSIWSTVWSIGLGEREENAFLVINLSGKVVKYNLISKTINEIFDTGSNQMDDDDDVESFDLLQLILTFMSSFRLLQVCNFVLEFVH
ncbi:hypothetical protein Tco_0972921 [Tanacetum coccineum]